MNQGLRRDTAVVTVCTLFSRVTGFGRVLATAAVLGSGYLGDVYQTANLIPNLMFELVAAGVLQAVLLPSYVAARREGGDERLSEAVRATVGVTGVALVGVAAIGMVLSPLVARLMVASEPSGAVAGQKLDVMVPMVLVFVPQLLCYGLATATSAALHAKGRFVAAALAPAVNNVIVIVACLAFRAARGGAVADLHLSSWEFALIAGGTTLGVLAYGLTTAAALGRRGVHWWPQWRPQHPAVLAMRRQFGWATLSIVGTLVPTAVALALGNGAPGGVAVFVYAFAFYVLPHALVAVPIATTLSPRVADHWQAGDTAATRDVIDSSLRLAVPLLVLAGAGMLALSWPVARVAAFGQTASEGIAPIAHTLAAFGPGLVGYGVAFILVRTLFALGDVKVASRLMIAGAVVGALTMALLADVMAPADRAAALAIGYGTSQAVTAILLARRAHELTGSVGLRTVGRLLGEAAVAGTVAIVVMSSIADWFAPTRRDSLEAVFVAGTVGVAAFTVAMASFRWRDLQGGLFSRRPAPSGQHQHELSG